MRPNKGWHSRGYLPHFDSSETIQFVTFRLADSLPSKKLGEWKTEVDSLLASESDRKRELQRRIEKFLDTGHGACELREESIARMVEQTMLHFDSQRYRLLSWVVMPNHVHALFEVWEAFSLGEVLHSWKSFSAQQVAKMKGARGHFWQADYFDRFIRDEEHFCRAVNYIENNPMQAGLCVTPEDWIYGSARLKSAD
jgi:putative DNA methylase